MASDFQNLSWAFAAHIKFYCHGGKSADYLSSGPNADFLCSTNPYGELYYDGITIDPFEVMFVKVKELLLERGWMYALHAKKYDAWLEAQVPPHIQVFLFAVLSHKTRLYWSISFELYSDSTLSK